MYTYTCSSDSMCGNCGKKSTAGGAVTCPLSSAKTGTTTTTVCTFCADNGNECCTTPTCDNIDGSSTSFAASSCPSSQSLKNDLSAVSCATTVCAASDCCSDPCPITNGATANTAGIDCKCGTSDCTSTTGLFCQSNTCHTSAFGSDALPDGDESWSGAGTGLRKVVSDWIGGGDLKKTVMTTYGSIEDWQVSGVTSLRTVFYNKQTFNADLSKWNVAAVTTLRQSTYNSTSFLSSLFIQ